MGGAECHTQTLITQTMHFPTYIDKTILLSICEELTPEVMPCMYVGYND